MKCKKLLHDREYVSTMLAYHYDVHAWEWDCKFWLVGEKWCADLEGKRPVGELDKEHAAVIEKLTPLIEQKEKENRNWIAFNKCRKRTCICKNCDKFCGCDGCNGKVIDCG